MTTKQLKSAAEELIDVLGLVDEKTQKPITISKKMTDSDIIELIKEAAAEIHPDDEISVETQEVIDELTKVEVPAAKPAKGKKVAPIIEEVEEEIEEDDLPEDAPDTEEEVDENEALLDSIDAAETLKELKAIVAGNTIFAKSAKKLNAIKDADDLREALLDIVEEANEVEEVVVKAPAPKAKKVAEPVADVIPAKGKKVVAPVKEEVEKPTKPVKPVKEEKPAKQQKEKTPRERNSAFASALDILGKTPKITLAELSQKVYAKGFDASSKNGIRSAHLMMRRTIEQLEKNGHKF